MHNVVIVEGGRTPFGSFGGGLAAVPAPDLAAMVMRAMLERGSIDAAQVDEVILGQVLQGGSGQAPARQAMRRAGIPDAAHAMTINKVCGSGMAALMLGADAIRLGRSGLVFAGGMESMSQAPYFVPKMRFGTRLGDAPMVDALLHDALRDPYSGKHMAEITESWLAEAGLPRERQDAYAARSYQRSAAAWESGRLGKEVVSVHMRIGKKETVIDRDEEPFRGEPSRLPELPPVFVKEGTITAGNASTINDGAAVLALASEEKAAQLGLTPRARILGQATFSTDPALFAEAPVGAVRHLLAEAGVRIADIDLFEINEAFAAVPLIVADRLGIDEERLNVNGGAVSIGHPVGASGARLALTLVNELEARGARLGVASLCIGGGEAVALLLERVG